MQLDTMLSLDEYARLPQDGQRLELSRGLLVRQPHPSPLHATVTARIYDVLRDYAGRAGGGRVVFDTGFILQEEPPTIRGPDVAFIGAPQTAERTATHVVHGAPRLAVEVSAAASDGTRAELMEKVFEYLDAGATAVWVVDLADRSVAAFEKGAEPRIYRRTDTIHDDRALPGFGCPVAAFFD